MTRSASAAGPGYDGRIRRTCADAGRGQPMIDWNVRWRSAWADLGVPPPRPDVLASLLARWAEPHRKYHTLQHLRECLGLFERCRGQVLPGNLVDSQLPGKTWWPSQTVRSCA
jgi:hypothetical protein